jgi:8-oxo-dGTP diphosphatase
LQKIGLVNMAKHVQSAGRPELLVAEAGQNKNTVSEIRPLTQVAVGVVLSPDGRQVLLGQRPAGKPYAGWWEMPGGKLEAGETVLQALGRELREELGIEVTKAQVWRVLEHEYPHAHVQLHFCKVLGFTGTPQSLEAQALAWCPIANVSVEPLLPAALPVLEWLRGND